MVVVYRDDQEAADALAEQLRRENDRLADENARLKSELADRPSADRRTRKQKRAAAHQPKRTGASATRTPGAKRTSPTPARDWVLRGLAGTVVGALAAYATAFVLYPAFNGGTTSPGRGVFSFVIAQVPIYLFISPGLLGRWDYDASKDGTLTARQRVLSVAGGLLLVAFVACLGSLESSGD